MDIKQIKELIALMEKAKIKKLHLKKEKGVEITLEKEDVSWMPQQPPHHFPTSPPPHHHHFPHSSSHHVPPSQHHEEGALKEQEGSHVTSPMVGTFLRLTIS